MSRFTPLLKKQIGTLSSQLIIVLTSLLTIVVVTRSLGLDSFGRVGLVGSIVGTIGVILQLGMGASLNRYLSAESSAEKQDQLFTNVLIIRLLILLPVIILLTQFSNMLLELV